MHECVRCGNTYQDNDSTILRGCTQCNGIFFLYMKRPGDTMQLDAVKKDLQKKDTTLERELVKQIKQKKAERARIKKVKEKPSKKPKRVKKGKVKRAVVKVGKGRFAVEADFGIETVRASADGVYEINIDALMKKKPIIVFGKGRIYIIHLPDVFEKVAKS